LVTIGFSPALENNEEVVDDGEGFYDNDFEDR